MHRNIQNSKENFEEGVTMINNFYGKISEEEIKKALRDVIGIRSENWLHTHDEIFKELENVKEKYFDIEDDVVKEENGESIKRTKEFLKKYFENYLNDFHEDFSKFFGENIMGDIIKHVANGIKGEKIESICRGKAMDMEEEKGIDITEGDNHIYMMAAVIIWESLISQASE